MRDREKQTDRYTDGERVSGASNRHSIVGGAGKRTVFLQSLLNMVDVAWTKVEEVLCSCVEQRLTRQGGGGWSSGPLKEAAAEQDFDLVWSACIGQGEGMRS